MGQYAAPPGYPQDIPGWSLPARLTKLARKCDLERGQRVFGLTAAALRPEYLVVPENHLAKFPQILDWPKQAAAPEDFHHRSRRTITRANLRPGETMLVHAAGSESARLHSAHAARPAPGPSYFSDCRQTRAGEAIWIKRSVVVTT